MRGGKVIEAVVLLYTVDDHRYTGLGGEAADCAAG